MLIIKRTNNLIEKVAIKTEAKIFTFFFFKKKFEIDYKSVS